MSPESRSPLANVAFRAVWLASVFSFVGTWVQNVGESWVMLSMSRDPRLVALLTTCFLVPTLVLTLPSGLLADRRDRRRLLLSSQALSAAAAAAPAVALHLHRLTPGVLLACTAVLGAAGALGAPAWQTLVPELVPREKTAEAVTLGSIAFNIARVVGPALGGVLLAATSPQATFVVNAGSFLAVLWVLARYDDVRRTSERPRPRAAASLGRSLAEPFRVVWRRGELGGTFVSAGVFMAAASVMLAILPAFAKHTLGASASGYGALLSALGCGAIVSGVALVKVRARLGLRVTVVAGMAVYGGGLLCASRAAHVAGAVPFFFLAGLGWMASLSSLSTTVQLEAPLATKSGVTALYQLNFYACASVGAVVGGAVALRWGERSAVALAAFGCLCACALAARALAAAERRPLGAAVR